MTDPAVRVKICGLTNLEDALQAAAAGADLLGFNFYPPSPRALSPEACAQISRELDARCPEVLRVGVFVNSGADEIRQMLDFCKLHLAQLSGDEPPEVLLALNTGVFGGGGLAFKALRPSDKAHLQQLVERIPPSPTPPAFLVDAYHLGMYGGTGMAADWELARGLAQRAPILLAGGLRPDNVAQAVAQAAPWGVDVASGVESAPGRKDFTKMQAFIRAAHRSTEEG